MLKIIPGENSKGLKESFFGSFIYIYISAVTAIFRYSKNKKSKGKKQKNKTILQATDKPVLNESRPIEEKQDLTNINYDEGYDGYYDDILPADENIEQQGLDKTVVKNLIFIAIGLIITISACVAAMYLM